MEIRQADEGKGLQECVKMQASRAAQIVPEATRCIVWPAVLPRVWSPGLR